MPEAAIAYTKRNISAHGLISSDILFQDPSCPQAALADVLFLHIKYLRVGVESALLRGYACIISQVRNARFSDTRSFGSERQDSNSEACLKVESPSSQLTLLYLWCPL
jgi:hypothetical protein